MTPEQRIAKLEALVAEQGQFIQQLQSANSIPLPVDRALRERLQIGSIDIEISSGFDLSQIRRTVNEAGMASYFVAQVPDEVGLVTANDGLEYGILLYNP